MLFIHMLSSKRINLLLACIIVTFHINCHYFLIWTLEENYFHTSNSNIFQCMNSTTFYYCKLTSKFIFLCFEQPGGDTGCHPVSSNRRPQPYQIESRPSEEEERVRESNDVKVSIFMLAEYILFKNKAL